MDYVYLVKEVSKNNLYKVNRTAAYKTIEHVYDEMKGKRLAPITDGCGHELTPEMLDKHLTYPGLPYRFYQKIHVMHTDKSDPIPYNGRRSDLIPGNSQANPEFTTEIHEFEVMKVMLH